MPQKPCDCPKEPAEQDVRGIKGMRGETVKGKRIEIPRERHWSHLELGSTRMVLIFDYILQAHPGGVRAISSLKSPNHQT